MKIRKILARQVLDSRGNPTVECQVDLSDGSKGAAIVPSGASTGSHEAAELRDGGKKFHGMGVTKAVFNANTAIAKAVAGMDAASQSALDRALVRLDGTPNKSRLGANALLAVSLASCRAQAQSECLPLYKHIARICGRRPALPVPFANIVNGGRHAGGGLAAQECMIAPVGVRSFSESVAAVAEIYWALKARLKKKFGAAAANVGDEGGFAPPFANTPAALDAIQACIDECGYSRKVRIAIDFAASEFYDPKRGKYSIDGKELSNGGMLDYHISLISGYRLASVEDPFFEDDFNSFAALTKRAGAKAQIVADDLTVTNPARIKKAVSLGAANCLLLKVNQIGTLSEAIEAANISFSHGWGVMVSHRSGETEDAFISDLAVGIGCRQIKLGAPCRGERTAKYNQLLRIEEALHSPALEWVR
ncbi:MAG: phosphopyruvate hydratase [Candidatus Micrarchaeota archaeon]